METYISRLSEIIGKDQYLYSFAVNNLELIDLMQHAISTHSRGHSGHLDALAYLFDCKGTDYDKEYNPSKIEILKIISELIRAVRCKSKNKKPIYILALLQDLKNEFHK